MATPSNSLSATGNAFLDSLSAATQARLHPQLARVPLHKGQVLSEPGATIREIYFPVRSVISTVTRMVDGGGVEVGLAGHEGMSALSVVFGSRISPHVTITQIADSAYRLSADVFLQLFKSDAALRDRALAYAEYSFIAAAQFAACNRLHAIDQRYARWLLMADDRVGNGEFVLTQEFSAQMLGVRRPGVTIVAGAMSAAGLISYRRGHIAVLDKPGLEAVACECYGVVNAELRRLMGYGVRHIDPVRLTA